MGIYRWTNQGASIGRTDFQHLTDGYTLNRNLFNIFPDKLQLRNRIKYYGMRLLGYCHIFRKKDRAFYKEHRQFCDNLKEVIISGTNLSIGSYAFCYSNIQTLNI